MSYNAIFPGQGAQKVGMGSALVTLPHYQYRLAQAKEVLGYDLGALMENGPQESLTQTAIAQPAIFVLSVILYELYREKYPAPCLMAGHSLGEYSALVCAQVLDFQTALDLVHTRGKLMQQACDSHAGSMLAVLKADPEQMAALIAEHQLAQEVCLANLNSPQQFVLSGKVRGLEELRAAIKTLNLGRAIPLKVSGAFHSPLMDSAAQAFEKHLDQVALRDAVIPIVTNCDGQVTQEAELLRDKLKRQILSPVYWQASVEKMGQAAGRFIEFGSSKVVGPLVQQTLPEAELVLVSQPQDWA